MIEPILAFISGDVWRWRKVPGARLGHVRGWGFAPRSEVAARTAAIVAHDRMITGDAKTRGIPSFWGCDV